MTPYDLLFGLWVTLAYVVLSLAIWEPLEIHQFPSSFPEIHNFEHWAPCQRGREACKCQDTTAVCTLTEDEFGFFDVLKPPVLLSAVNVTTLIFYNSLPEVPKLGVWSGCFEHVDDVSTVYISSPKQALYPGIGDFPRVEVLHLDLPQDEEWDIQLLDYIQMSSSLRELYLYRIHNVDTADASWWRKTTDSRPFRADLTILGFIDCRQDKMDMKDLKRLMKNLKALYFSGAHIPELHYDYLTSLEQLSLINDYATSTFPETCDAHNGPYFSNLTQLLLDGNSIRIIPSKICLPRLKYLSLRSNPLSVFTSGQFSELIFPKLTHLSLKGSKSVIVSPKAFSNPYLQSIDLSNGRVSFALDVNERAFDGCPNLTQVNLENNVFKDISVAKLELLFVSLESVQVLNLRKTGFSLAMGNTFKPLKKIRHLLLNDNAISIVKDGAFAGLDDLSTLRLDNNYITSLSKDAFGSETLGRLTSLNLSRNPFECTCSLLWLHQKLYSNPALLDVENPGSRYECANLPGTLVADVFVNVQQCLLSHDAYVFTVVCSAILIFTLTSAMLLYRYRWHIRLVLYEVFRGNPQARWRQRRPEDFQFDLFVSYDSEDVRWVLDHLIPALEQNMGLRLCIHQRDFIPGKNITDNIVDCLAVSKRVLAVFSPNFAESQWCQFELEMCLSHVVDNDDVMVVVILQHVPVRDMSGAMIALLRTTTYIEWGESPDAVDSFWRRLALALNDILPGVRP